MAMSSSGSSENDNYLLRSSFTLHFEALLRMLSHAQVTGTVTIANRLVVS